MLAAEVSRRGMLALASTLLACPVARASDEEVALIRQITGKLPTESDRVQLSMPRSFPNGYTVPLVLQVDSAMTAAEHVTSVRVLAPKNPLVEVATFRFTPSSGAAYVSTRVRLAGPQFVLAAAEMSDGALLMARAWVDAASDGCK